MNAPPPQSLPQSPPRKPPQSPPQVTVVVIGHNDAAHVGDAVASALAQGPAVGEVLAVDDCSTDESAALLSRLAEREPRLRVLRRAVNSGGCGTPRNTGIDAAALPYVMFLDSDDLLPPGAVDALLTAATGAGAEVAAGLCVRRELPSGREQPWQQRLFTTPAVVADPAGRPRLVHDTLCVNKLYRTAFLREHGIRFPEGRFLYEDFVFTARVLAAAPRLALIPDRVYLWHVRRSAERLSLSLDRDRIDNWTARTEACAQAYDILLGAGREELARAARAKFLDHELRMYAKELPLRDEAYRRAWWAHTRSCLARFDAADWERDPAAPGCLLGRVIMASPEPRDLPRLRELAARPARLLPPYARTPDANPVWSPDLPRITLTPLLTRPPATLPLTIEAEVRPLGPLRGTLRLHLTLYELYGRVAEAGPRDLDVTWHRRETGEPARRTRTRLAPATTGDAPTWTADLPLRPAALGTGTWDLRLALRFADGTHRDLTAHAHPATTRRHALPSARHGLLLIHPYATHSGSLALRVATGPGGAMSVLRGRAERFRRTH